MSAVFSGFLDVRGEGLASIDGEAAVLLPAGESVVVEGESAGRRVVQISLGDRVAGTYAPVGRFSWKFRSGPEQRLKIRVLQRRPSLFDQLSGQVVAAVRDPSVRIATIKVDGQPVVDFSQPVRSYLGSSGAMGINVIGFFKHAFGIGESARCMARACGVAGVDAAFVEARIGTDSLPLETEFDGVLQAVASHAVNVFHLDPPQMGFVDECHGAELMRGRRNIGYWAWELPEFPDVWLRYFERLDEVWVPSSFVRDAIAPRSPVPVCVMPHAIRVGDAVADRMRWSFGENEVVFLCLFDLNSSRVRKNPDGAVAAFIDAFPKGDDVRLVLKVHGGERHLADLEALQTMAARHPGITLIDVALARHELSSLMQSSDVFVSLHRAEGFGIALAEAMGMGKPVIATGWSGNLDFMNATNSCLVGADVVEIQKTSGPYQAGQHWAEPRIDEAADWMKRLAADAELRTGIGRQARASVMEQLAPGRIGRLYAERLRTFLLWP